MATSVQITVIICLTVLILTIINATSNGPKAR